MTEQLATYEGRRADAFLGLETLFRWISLSVATIYIVFGDADSLILPKVDLYLLMVFGFLYLIAYKHLLPWSYPEFFERHLFSLEIFTDVVGSGLCIWVTGAHDSPLIIFYYVFLVRAAFVFEKRLLVTKTTWMTATLLVIMVAEVVLTPDLSGFLNSHFLHLVMTIGVLWAFFYVGWTIASFQNSLVRRTERLALMRETEIRKVDLLNRVSQIIGSGISLEKTCLSTIRELGKTIAADRFSLSIVDEGGDKVQTYTTSGQGKMLEEKMVPSPEARSIEWLSQHQTYMIRNDLERRSFDDEKELLDAGMRSCLSLPLVVQDRLRGSFSLYSRKPGKFSERYLEILTPVAEQLARAIETVGLYRRLKHQAEVDPLTDLYNYAYMHDFLDQALEQAAHNHKSVSLLMVDIDDFDVINEQDGHAKGDEVLQRFARVLRKNLREGDIAARYGGDQFMLVLPESGYGEAHLMVDQIKLDVAKQSSPGTYGGRLTLEISFGIATYPSTAKTKEDMIQTAAAAIISSRKNLAQQPSA